VALTDRGITYKLPEGGLVAYEKVFMALYKQLHAYAFLLLKDQHQAEEVVQEVFCRVWERRNKMNMQQSLQAYLYTSVHHECLREMKRRKTAALSPVDYMKIEFADDSMRFVFEDGFIANYQKKK
jgi:RNA polymerase sigma-70 factor (ECF subfamily)